MMNSDEDEMPLNKILIVDDEATNRSILSAIIKKEGYIPLLAENGQDAVSLFELHEPSIVLMDIQMPVMDGYEATKRIKKIAGGKFVSVIFLTALDSDADLKGCREAGGDDFLVKPYKHEILKAKIKMLSDLGETHKKIQEQKKELSSFHQTLQHEKEVAERVFDNIVNDGFSRRLNVQGMFSSLALFDGDVVFAVDKPSGGVHVMLCDFTGHGLSAAIGAMPVSLVIKSMTKKGYSIRDIVKELNDKLYDLLPADMFCAACMIDIDPANRLVNVWNGGLPAQYYYGGGHGEAIRLESRNLPLGVVQTDRVDFVIDVYPFVEGAHLLLHSDGVTESRNQQGEHYGEERIEFLLSGTKAHDAFCVIRNDLEVFRGSAEQLDDITLTDIILEATDFSSLQDAYQPHDVLNTPPADWKVIFELDFTTLKSYDVVPLVMQHVMKTTGATGYLKEIHLMLSELFMNALDHGVLSLDSSMKSGSDGFMEFYREKEKRLANLQAGNIILELECHAAKGQGELRLRISDSGDGFDYTKKMMVDNSSSFVPSGRGMAMVKELCQSLKYQGKGNCVDAIYEWG